MITVKLKHLTLEFSFGFFLILSLTTFFRLKLVYLYLFSALIHELSHAISMIIFNCDCTTIRFTALGFTLKSNGIDELPKLKQFIVCLSGCMVNLLLIIVSYRNQTALLINVLIIVYNLLPIEGFDGDRILKLYHKKR